MNFPNSFVLNFL